MSPPSQALAKAFTWRTCHRPTKGPPWVPVYRRSVIGGGAPDHSGCCPRLAVILAVLGGPDQRVPVPVPPAPGRPREGEAGVGPHDLRALVERVGLDLGEGLEQDAPVLVEPVDARGDDLAGAPLVLARVLQRDVGLHHVVEVVVEGHEQGRPADLAHVHGEVVPVVAVGGALNRHRRASPTGAPAGRPCGRSGPGGRPRARRRSARGASASAPRPRAPSPPGSAARSAGSSRFGSRPGRPRRPRAPAGRRRYSPRPSSSRSPAGRSSSSSSGFLSNRTSTVVFRARHSSWIWQSGPCREATVSFPYLGIDSLRIFSMVSMCRTSAADTAAAPTPPTPRPSLGASMFRPAPPSWSRRRRAPGAACP